MKTTFVVWAYTRTDGKYVELWSKYRRADRGLGTIVSAPGLAPCYVGAGKHGEFVLRTLSDKQLVAFRRGMRNYRQRIRRWRAEERAWRVPKAGNRFKTGSIKVQG